MVPSEQVQLRTVHRATCHLHILEPEQLETVLLVVLQLLACEPPQQYNSKMYTFDTGSPWRTPISPTPNSTGTRPEELMEMDGTEYIQYIGYLSACASPLRCLNRSVPDVF